MLGLSEYETRDYKNALIHLEKAQGLGIQGSPEAIRIAQYHLAVLLNQDREFERAVELLSAGRPEGELVTQWNIALGMGLLRVPELPEQVEPSQRPMFVAAGQAATLLANSKYDEAFVVLQKLLKDYPRTPFIHYAYGAALASLSQYDEAEAQLHEEMRISPDTALPYIRIAFIDMKTHRSADALTAAQRAVQLAPLSPKAHHVLGRALLGTGETVQAIQELQAANEMMPNSPETTFTSRVPTAKPSSLRKLTRNERHSHGSTPLPSISEARMEARRTALPMSRKAISHCHRLLLPPRLRPRLSSDCDPSDERIEQYFCSIMFIFDRM